MARKTKFGSTRKLPSGRWQARYTDHNGQPRTARTADDKPLTFDTKKDAEGWLKAKRDDVYRAALLPPEPEPEPTPDVPTLRAYATAWVPARRNRKGQPLTPKTQAHYLHLLRKHVFPALGDLALTDIDKATVRTWFADLEKSTGPTAAAHAYSLLRTILRTAVEDEAITANPCHIRGAGRTERVRQITVPTVDQVAALAEAVPARYKTMILMAAWCGLRYGEASALRRGDVDLKARVVKVRRGVTRAGGTFHEGAPKSAAGIRDVPIPPHILAAVKDHLREHTEAGADDLLFPAPRGGLMLNTSAHAWFGPAKRSVGMASVRFHDLRHHFGTRLALAGATTKEIMVLMGHSTPNMSMRYQHMVSERPATLADRLSEIARATPGEPERAALSTEGAVRGAPLSATQQRFMAHMAEHGSVSDADSFSITTARVLESRGLITLEVWHADNTLMGARRYEGPGWIAKPVNRPALKAV